VLLDMAGYLGTDVVKEGTAFVPGAARVTGAVQAIINPVAIR
jgi:hypothetical protein